MADEAEVVVKLVLSGADTTKALADAISKSFDKISGSASKANTSVKDIAASFYLAKNAAEGVYIAVDNTLVKAVAMADAEAMQVLHLESVLSLYDRQNRSMQQMRDTASELHEHFKQVAIRTGFSADKFESIAESLARTSVPADKLAALSEKLQLVGRGAPGGGIRLAESIARFAEFGQLGRRDELGPILAKSGLIVTKAKDLAGQIREINMYMRKMPNMTEETRVKIATAAVEKYYDRMKAGLDMKPTFSMLTTSFSTIANQVFLEAGKTLLDGLIPGLTQIRDKFIEDQYVIYEAARRAADYVARIFMNVTDYIVAHWDQIEASARRIADIIQKATDGFSFAVKNGPEELRKWTMGSPAPGTSAAIPDNFTDKLASDFQEAAGFFASDVKKHLENLGVDAMGGLPYAKSRADLAQSEMEHARVEGNIKAWDEANQNYKDAVGQQLRTAQEMFDAAESIEEMAKSAEELFNARKRSDKPEDEASRASAARIEEYRKKFSQELDANDVYDLKNQIAAAGSNQEMLTAFAQTFRTMDMSKLDPAMFARFPGEQEGFQMAISKAFEQVKTAAKESKFNMTWTGNMVVHQDFRDQDPDNIAIVMKNSVGQALGAPR